MRILFLAWRDLAHPQAGGSESMVDRLALGAIERGHEVALVCGGPVGRRPYPVVDAGGKYTQYLRAPFVSWRRFRGYDVVVDVENGIPFFSPLWWPGPVVCLVHHVHGPQWRMHFGPLTAAFGSFLERKVMPRVYRGSTFCAVSPWTAGALVELGIDRSHIAVVPPGIDFPESMTERRKADEPIFLALGRLVPHKRIDLLLRAWERVRPVTGGRLVVAGDGPERDRLSSLATDGVEIRGRISEDEKSELFTTAWLLLHPSLHEGWGSGIIEAAAHGMPALGFDVPGVRDAIVAGETGELAHDEDEFVRRWQELATDGPRRQRLGAAARERAAQFQWKMGVEELLRVAEVAVASPPGTERPEGLRRTLAFLTAFRHRATLRKRG